MWPPWPLNIIKERMDKLKSSLSTDLEETSSTGDLAQNDDRERKQQQSSSMYPSMGALFFAYARQQTRIGIRQIQEVSSQVWFNLPPAIPPIILFSSFPRRVKVWEGGKASEAALRRIPLFSSEPVRTFVLAGLGIAVLSWSNQELQRKRKLTPLILPLMNNEKKQKGGRRRVSSVFLPPFLPEDVTYDPEIEALLRSVDNNAVGRDDNVSNHLIGGDDDDEQNILSRVSPKIRKHLSGIYETTTATPKRMLQYKYSDWKLGRAARKREVAKIRRNRVFDELVALQVLKKRQKAVSIKKKRKYGSTNAGAVVDETEEEVGYAIVTGASKGIGRAIAVELARWEIPMILVARDVEKLSNLAYDLEACYGVKCCVLGADLSKVDAAERIHQATTEAGISVDILVNNAGIASEGLAVDKKTSDIEKMVMLNSLTYAKLSQLYGQDMKKKRRGRILMMSSMAGLCSASPNTAIYGACKAFGKSLSLSMAKEMEAYGVGVTCLIPGPVADTDFRESSGTRKALCWYLPFYSRSPDIVAHQVSCRDCVVE
jgi:short-subunit dehydrogenase